MKKYAPLATLVAVVLLGAGFLVVNILGNPDNQKTQATGRTTSAGPVVAGPTAPAPAAEPTPQPPPEPAAPVVAEKAYTGRSSGNEVTVAVAVKDGRAVAYVCDGKKIEAWMEGSLKGGTLSLTGKTSNIAGTVDDKATFGTVVIDGKEWPFSAKGVVAPAGLYEGRGTLAGVATRVGWIVDGNGKVTGVMSAVGGGNARPAPALDPSAPAATVVDGTPIAVTAIDGGTTVIRR
jgi:hypothetical protein